MNERPAQRLAATWFLGAIGVAVLLFLWARGAARFVVPVAVIALLGYGVARFLRVLRAPVD